MEVKYVYYGGKSLSGPPTCNLDKFMSKCKNSKQLCRHKTFKNKLQT